MGRIRFRLLGIRWDWRALTRGVLQPVVLTALAERRARVLEDVARRMEQDYPVGQVVYQDDDGLVLVVPGFYEGDGDEGERIAEQRFLEHVLEPLLPGLEADLSPLGVGAAVRLAWSEPALYLTDYAEVMDSAPTGHRERLVQVGEDELRGLWAVAETGGLGGGFRNRRGEEPSATRRSGGEEPSATRRSGASGTLQVCPQCGLRPARARELYLHESTLEAMDYCDHCGEMADPHAYQQRWRQAEEYLGFRPKRFNLQDIRRQRNGSGNARVVLVSVQVDAAAVARGEFLLGQLARPSSDMIHNNNPLAMSAEQVGACLQQAWAKLRAPADAKELEQRIGKEQAALVRTLLGDEYWLKAADGRVEGDAATKARAIAEAFFLREWLPADAGLARHSGDRLALFGMRKHASPARLARTWDDLRALWRSIAGAIEVQCEGWALPLSLDARGLRVIVAADDAGAVLKDIRARVDAMLGRARAGLPVHVSALVFREKFPLYLALDGIRRMERRVATAPPREWTLARRHQGVDGNWELYWDTGQGEVRWDLPTTMGDAQQQDLWNAYGVCPSRPAGPGRLVRLRELEPGESLRLHPSSFDFAVLDGSARRYQLRYDGDGRRPHFILGEEGKRPYLLEQLQSVLELADRTGWNPSQAKGILGRVVECYEKWVRDAPPALREQGRRAWHHHTEAILRRYLPGDPALRGQILDGLDAGLLFDAFEWSGFIEKSADHAVVETENLRQTGT